MSVTATALAIILARAGSKGVPGKNAAIIAGKPCVLWTIEAALSARGVGSVAVSTDDPRVASVARGSGVTVIDRPPELATDLARVDDAARHAVVALSTSATGGVAAGSGGHVVILYANVPVRPPGLVGRALDLLVSTGCDSVQSYAPAGKNHPWWTARVDPVTGRVASWEGDVLNHGVFRRQDLPPAFIPDGGVIALTRPSLFLEVPGVQPGPHAFFGHDRRGVVTEEGSVIDIDSPTDLLVADAVLRQQPLVRQH
ncbi:MAG: acylneuraminate cytidylyltransferase family protein [Phycisphaerales bacterium]|nr:acylneuraminate cytidylyltransferase family protein [Phycisphaerales bacterium]